jgi:hypothetical protein
MRSTEFALVARDALPFWWVGQTAPAASERGVSINEIMLRSGVGGRANVLTGNSPDQNRSFSSDMSAND